MSDINYKNSNAKNMIVMQGVSKFYMPYIESLKLKHNKDYIAKKCIKAVVNVDLEIPEGQIFGILGANGAGKTTIIKMLCGLIKPTTGNVFVGGFDVQTHKEQALAKIGAVVEVPTLYSNLTGMQNLRYFAKIQGGVSDKTIENIVDLVGLRDRINSKFSTYSLGMKQKLGIAQAIMHNPKLLILDEPINGLDPSAIISVRELLKNLAKNHGTTILISSHILSEMQELCDRVGFMVNGKMVQIKSVDEILSGEIKERILAIKCDNIQLAKQLIESNFECQTKIVDDKLFIKLQSDFVSQINKLLVNNDIAIQSINVKTKTLEDAYKELIK